MRTRHDDKPRILKQFGRQLQAFLLEAAFRLAVIMSIACFVTLFVMTRIS